ncbi:MAG: hypothetical protein CM15mP74_29650 [Halieaceae bacterium]|nr:MAG: hypothetical protein CM15mP74_29650 [Halieaceae bacterium]
MAGGPHHRAVWWQTERDNPLLKTRAWHDPALMAADQPADEGLRALGFPEAAIRLINANNSYGNNCRTPA